MQCVASMQRSGIEGRRCPPTTVPATHATAASDGSWWRSRGRFAAAIGKSGIVAGSDGVCPAACVATYAFRQHSERRLGFRGSLSCRMGQLLTHKMPDVLPRFHCVASRLRWPRRRRGRFAARSALGASGGIMFVMGKLAVFIDWRGLRNNFHVPTPFARYMHAFDAH